MDKILIYNKTDNIILGKLILGDGRQIIYNFQGNINSNDDFPTTATVQSGYTYYIEVPVTDDNPTKTNTGLSFTAGETIVWNGTSWSVITNIINWGSISGLLDNQTDLQNALNAKVSTTGNETIAGTKTFTGSITASNLSGTNTGDETATSIITKIGAASSSNNGYLSSTDWITFNSKQPAGNYATGGGTATGTNTGDETKDTIESKLIGDISSHTHDGRYYTETEVDTLLGNKVYKTTTITINGTTYDLSDNRTWTISGGGGGSLNYIAVTSNQSISPSNFYGVTCTTSDITLTLADGTSIGENLTIKKLDNTPYNITISGNIEQDGSIIIDTQFESIDLFWNGTYYLIK